MRLPATSVLAFLVVAAIFAAAPSTPVKAQSSGAHFQKKGTGASCSGTDLTLFWVEAGLGNANVNYTASCLAQGTYECINGGNNHPKAANKETVFGAPQGNATFTPENGSVSGEITLSPPGPGDFSCPSGQTLVLASVTYSSCTVTDTTNNVTLNYRGSFTCP